MSSLSRIGPIPTINKYFLMHNIKLHQRENIALYPVNNVNISNQMSQPKYTFFDSITSDGSFLNPLGN